jgi:hypothetical protein
MNGLKFLNSLKREMVSFKEFPKTRLQLCDKNFFNYSIKLFISLPLDIRRSDKYSNFN